MATRKRHNKTQFVIPEEVQGAVETGWTFKTDAIPKAATPIAAPMQAPATLPATLMDNPLESGMRAMSYSFYALYEMILFSTRVATMPLTIAGRMFRG
jgi:hypothetical protein